MATVWLARDLRHERSVAIKILHPELAGAIGIDRFLREIRLTAQLQHPNIVPILDSGVLEVPEGRLPWYAMSFLEGESLRARLAREGQIGVEEAMAITEAAAWLIEQPSAAYDTSSTVSPSRCTRNVTSSPQVGFTWCTSASYGSRSPSCWGFL